MISPSSPLSLLCPIYLPLLPLRRYMRLSDGNINLDIPQSLSMSLGPSLGPSLACGPHLRSIIRHVAGWIRPSCRERYTKSTLRYTKSTLTGP